MLTFDDGYADFHRRAMPLLDAHGFTATLFVTTGWEQDADMRRSAPGRMLNHAQLAEAAAAGIEIGAHTRSHPQLDPLPEQLVRDELCASKRVARGQARAAGARTRLPLRLLERPGQAAWRASPGYRYAHAVDNRTAEPARRPIRGSPG